MHACPPGAIRGTHLAALPSPLLVGVPTYYLQSPSLREQVPKQVGEGPGSGWIPCAPGLVPGASSVGSPGLVEATQIHSKTKKQSNAMQVQVEM